MLCNCVFENICLFTVKRVFSFIKRAIWERTVVCFTSHFDAKHFRKTFLSRNCAKNKHLARMIHKLLFPMANELFWSNIHAHITLKRGVVLDEQ